MRKLDVTGKINPNIADIQEEVKDIIRKFGSLIAKIRKDKNIKLQELSSMSGVSIGVISDLENRKGKIPNLYTLVALARTLGISNDEFLQIIFGEVIHRDTAKKDPRSILEQDLIAYGVPTDVITNMLNGIDLIYKTFSESKLERSQGWFAKPSARVSECGSNPLLSSNRRITT